MTDEARARYADEIARLTGIRSREIILAFATIRREQFLGPPPWRVLSFGSAGLETTEVSDPAGLYQNAAVMLDASRNLANGNPGTIAPWLDALNLSWGASVFHLGCGTGYYTAIMAEVVGPKGRVTAVEVDRRLASMARECLRGFRNVDVIEGDGGALDPGPTDAILAHAGVTHPAAAWLDSLKPGGSLIAPLTMDVGMPNVGKGFALHVERKEAGFAARFLPGPVMIYSCSSLRDAEAGKLLGAAMTGGGSNSVQSLRRDAHAAEPECWLHAAQFCLSTRPPAMS